MIRNATLGLFIYNWKEDISSWTCDFVKISEN